MSQITRRAFFEESMIATAAAAALTSTGQSTQAAETKKASANDTIRHAILGCRIRGRAHAKEFAGRNGVDVTYVCDPDETLVNELADAVEKLQGHRPKTVRDMRVIFDDENVDTVSVAAPNHWHALAAIWAMQAGKDVYVEKPVSHNISEGRRIVQVSRKTGRICQAGTQRRSDGSLAEAARYIREGKLGEVTFARSIVYGRRGSIGKRGTYDVPANIDYSLWLGPAPMEPLARPKLHYDWHWVWATGGGELGNNNIHYIDVVRMLMGLEGLGDSAISVGGRMGYQDAGETPNTQMVVHTFGPTTVMQEVRGLKSDPFSKKFKAGWVIHGSEGFIAESTLFDPAGKSVKTFKGTSENHFANFIKAVRSRKREELNADILEGHLSSSLCHVGNISHRLGRPASVQAIAHKLSGLHPDASKTFNRMTSHLKQNGVDLTKTRLALGPLLRMDSTNETFVNSAQANALVSRTYRKPFVVPAENEI